MSIQPDPMFRSTTKTALPYAGTAGAAGSDASRERAESEAAEGVAEARQRRILEILAEAGILGATWAEISEKTGQHHGKVTGALSSMHKAGLVAALKFNRRNNSGVYVLPEYIVDRPVRAFKSNAAGASSAHPARPHLTSEEKDALVRLEQAAAQNSDRPIQIFTVTARILASALRRLDRP
jgi:tRNA nucleotidyltransferase/poly(A) polymerase